MTFPMIQFENCLKRIFAKYCTPSPSNPLELPESAYLSLEGLDRWATDTNGEAFSQETKDELLEFMDVNEEGHLTCDFQLLLTVPDSD